LICEKPGSSIAGFFITVFIRTSKQLLQMKKIILSFLALGLYMCLQAQVNSATFGMMEARQLGPGTMSGRITDIDGVISENGKTLYVGTAGGGVWKSTNAGASFKPVFDKYCQSIGALAIDQKNPKVVYVATGESNMRNSVSIGVGVYKTTDGGDNWTKIGLDSTEHIARLTIDPRNSDVIYAAAPGPLWSDSKHRGLYKSSDAGKTWDKILYISDKAGCAEVVLDPKNPDVVYATTWEFRRQPYNFNSGGTGSGVWKSLDGGKTWKELTNGLPAKPFGRVAFNLAPSAPNNLFAIVESNTTGLYISADGGETWKQQSATLNVIARPFYFSTIEVDPEDAKRVYRPSLSFSYSSDGGYSFADASGDGGWVHSDHHALWINPKNTSVMYLGTDGGVYISLDKGTTWMFCQGLPVGQFYHVSTDNKKPYHVYGGLQDNGSWVAPSSAPGGVSNAAWQSVNGGDGFWVQPDPTDENYAYAESQGGNMNRVNLKNFKAVEVKPQQGAGEEKLRWNWNTPIVTGAKNPKNLYVAAQYVYKTTNNGRNWTRISPDLTTNDKKKLQQENSGGLSADNTSAENHCTVFAIAESPLDENIIWAGTDDGNLQYTTDGGKTWTNTSKNVAAAGVAAQAWVSSIEPSAFDKQTVYATFENHMYGDHKTYCAKSTDMGKTWQVFKSDEFTGFAHKIKEDPVNSSLLFLGTEMGLFATLDGGANWFRMKSNIPWYSLVRDIKIQPATNDLVLATHGRGIIILDDISPMRAMTKEIVDKDFHIFNMAPVVLRNGDFGGGGFPSTGGWVGANAPAAKPIMYYLKDRLSSGDVKIEIYDKAGTLVKSLPGGKRKGINMVYWDYRSLPPKTATGGVKPDFAGFIAPMVMPGDYTVKIKVAGKEYGNTITMVHDAENKDFTLADREAQYQAATQMKGMVDQVAKLVEEVNAKQKMLKENTDKVKSAKVKKLLEEYNAKLEAYRGTLLATKNKSIFADERRLREDISEVYAAVCGQEAKPGNLQMERVKMLQQEVQKAETAGKTLTAQYEIKVAEALAKEGVTKPESKVQPGKTTN
jgi:photosystem II stability/assembly factor-like uncharacterized protein